MGELREFTLRMFFCTLENSKDERYASVSTHSCIFSFTGWSQMSWGWNNGNNKWIKGKFTDIETSPHSQLGACIKILQQDTYGIVSAILENLILHPCTFCDSTRRLRQVEKLINHQPTVIVFCVIDCSVKTAYKRWGGASVSISVCYDTAMCLSRCVCAPVFKFNTLLPYEWPDSWWHSVTLHKHGMTYQQGHTAVATSKQMAVIPLTSVSGCPCCKIYFPSRPETRLCLQER